METNLEKEASTNSPNFELNAICWKVLLQVQLQILNQATHFFICCERVFSVARCMCTPKKLAGTMCVQIYVKWIPACCQLGARSRGPWHDFHMEIQIIANGLLTQTAIRDRRKASLKPSSSSRCSSDIWHLSPNSFCTASSNLGPWLEHRAIYRDLQSSSERNTSSIESTLCTNQKALAASGTEAASAAAAAVVQKRVACGPAASAAAAAAAVTEKQVSQSAWCCCWMLLLLAPPCVSDTL